MNFSAIVGLQKTRMMGVLSGNYHAQIRSRMEIPHPKLSKVRLVIRLGVEIHLKGIHLFFGR